MVGAVQRVEGLSRDAGSVLGPAMVGAENLFVGTERGFGGAQCFSRVTRGDQQAGKMATRAICVGMLGAERLLVDRQRALEERPRRREVALVLQQAGEVVEARRRLGMLGAERLLADRQRALEERPRRREVALVLQQAARLLRLVAVSGCSGPSAFSRIASARS